jgi:DNA-binding PadR family transcriptional regulator
MPLKRDLFLGLVKLHILHHAGREPVYGAWLIEELRRHGYTLSSGTLYPMLHGLEAERLLSRERQVVEGRVRKIYRLTAAGREALARGRSQVVELLREIDENSDPRRAG